MNVFELMATLSLDSSSYDKGLNKSEKSAKGFATKLGGGLKTAAKIGTAAIATVTASATALTGVLTKNISETAKYGDSVDKMSQKMNISAEAYQEWDAVMKHSGTSIDALKPSMKTLANQAQKGAEEFQKLGISEKEVATLSQEDLFAKVISGLQGMEKGTERTAITSKLLGRGATELGALLNTSAKETQKMKDKVRELGGVMSNKAVKDSAKFQDTLQDLKTSISGIKRNIAVEFLPSVTKIMEGVTGVFAGSKNGTAKLEKGISQFLNKMNKQLPKAFNVTSSTIGTVINVSLKNLPKLINNTVPMLMKSITGVVTQIGKTFPQLVKSIFSKGNIRTFINSALPLVDGVLDALPEAIPAIVEGATNLVNGVVSALPTILSSLTSKLPGIIGSILTSVSKGLTSTVRSIGETIANVWLSAFGTSFKTTEERLEQSAEKARIAAENVVQFSDKIKEAESNFSDTSKILSEHGRTEDEVRQKTDEVESKILDILKKARRKKRKVREKELDDILAYKKQLASYQKEETDIYTKQAKNELEKIRREVATGAIDQETAAKRIAAVKSYTKKADESLEKQYQSRITLLDNQYSTEKDKRSKAYKDQLEQIDKWYKEQEEKNKNYITTANTLISQQAGNWIASDKGKYEALAKYAAQFRSDTTDETRNFYMEQLAQSGHLDGVKAKFQDYYAEIDNDNTVAFLNMLATTKNAKKPISEANKKIAEKILASFEGLPKPLQEAGKESLVSLAGAFSGTKAGERLKNASSMSTETILKTMREGLGLDPKKKVNAESKEFKSIGQSMGLGLISGLWSTINSIIKNIKTFSSNILNAFKSWWNIKSPSKVMKNVIGKNLALGLGEGFIDTMDALSDDMVEAVPTDFLDTSIDTIGTISSPTTGANVNQTFSVEINNPQVRSDDDLRKLSELIGDELGQLYNQRSIAYG